MAREHTDYHPNAYCRWPGGCRNVRHGANYLCWKHQRIKNGKSAINSLYVRLRKSACERCGWDEAPCDVHRIIPQPGRGGYVEGNVVTLCPNCHRLVSRGIVKFP